MSDFSRIFGNEDTKKRLSAAIRSNTLPHAFIICGPRGSGKRTLAVEIARAVNCGGSSLPCGFCATCRRIKEENFTDVKYLRRSGGKATIGVEELRDFKNDMFLSPTESAFKFYIIEEADLLTPSAQNALLKVLEEPPSGVLILLLSATGDGILTTIKSRTQHVSMQRFEADDIKRYLASKGKLLTQNQDKLTAILMCSDGRIGRTLELIGEGAEDAEAQRRTTEAILLALRKNVPYSTLLAAIRMLPTKKDEFASAIESVISAIRDLILLKNTPNAPLIFYSDRDAAIALAEDFNLKRLLSVYDVMTRALEDNSRNVSVLSIITVIGAKIKFL